MPSWTIADEEYLRVNYRKPLDELAATLGRTVVAIKTRIHVLGLSVSGRRAWTAAEDEYLIEHYGSVPAKELSGRIKRSRSSLYQRADKLGLVTRATWLNDEKVIDAIRQLHPLGYSDPEIARELKESTGIKTDRHRVSELRRRLGLASNARSQRRRFRVAMKTREQLDKAGVASLAEVRVAAFAEWKRSYGWPDNLTVRAVQALELFYLHGPMTRIQLCLKMGVSTRSRTEPKSNGHGGTVLAELAAAGLVTKIAKAIKIDGQLKIHDDPTRPTRKCKTKHINLYLLNPGVEPNEYRTRPKRISVIEGGSADSELVATGARLATAAEGRDVRCSERGRRQGDCAKAG